MVTQIAASDGVALGMIVEPAFAALEQLFDFVFADPVVFLVVEDRNKDIKMVEQLSKNLAGLESDSEIAALAPFWKLLIERKLSGFDGVTERLKKRTEKRLASTARNYSQSNFERESSFCEFGAHLAASRHGGAEDSGDRDAKKRRADIRTVIYILIEGAAFSGRAARFTHEANGVNAKQQCSCALRVRRFRIKDMRGAERKLEIVNIRWVLSKKMP